VREERVGERRERESKYGGERGYYRGM